MITFYCLKTAFYRYGGFIYRDLLSGIIKNTPGAAGRREWCRRKIYIVAGITPHVAKGLINP